MLASHAHPRAQPCHLQVRSKCEAVLWIGACIWLLRYLDFVHVVLESNKVDRYAAASLCGCAILTEVAALAIATKASQTPR
eukprot:COSAG01_NODE_306_length_19162_cov_14.196611_13_plen_81_part_00